MFPALFMFRGLGSGKCAGLPGMLSIQVARCAGYEPGFIRSRTGMLILI